MTCSTGKIPYPSAAAAKHAHSKFRRAGKRKAPPNRAYQCPICHQWHLTSTPKPWREMVQRKKL